MNIMKISHPTVFNIILTCKVWGGREGLVGEPIPFIGGGSIKFLGMRIQVPNDVTATKEALTANLDQMLQEVDTCPLTRQQKLGLYKAGICPRLSWLLLIEELPITWVERDLEASATRYLKKCAGLAKTANTALLYLPKGWEG